MTMRALPAMVCGCQLVAVVGPPAAVAGGALLDNGVGISNKRQSPPARGTPYRVLFASSGSGFCASITRVPYQQFAYLKIIPIAACKYRRSKCPRRPVARFQRTQRSITLASPAPLLLPRLATLT